MLEPEWLVWSADEEYVLVNLQENAGLVKVNVADGVAEDIYSYGLKDWSETPIDVIEDDGCETMPTVDGLYSVRTPDSITAIIVGEDTYIATANEVRFGRSSLLSASSYTFLTATFTWKHAYIQLRVMMSSTVRFMLGEAYRPCSFISITKQCLATFLYPRKQVTSKRS